MKLLERKKYNKIILITKGNNDRKDFILNARKIIGSNTIAAVSAYEFVNHINQVKEMENVLILNGSDFHEKFFKFIIKKDADLFYELKNEIINFYNNMPGFYFTENREELFNFPNFKNGGKFEDLNFEVNDF